MRHLPLTGRASTSCERHRQTLGACRALAAPPVARRATQVRGRMARRVRLGSGSGPGDGAAAPPPANPAGRRRTREAPRVPVRRVQRRRPRPHLWGPGKVMPCRRLSAVAAAKFRATPPIGPLIPVARSRLTVAAATYRGGRLDGALRAPIPSVRKGPSWTQSRTHPREPEIPPRLALKAWVSKPLPGAYEPWTVTARGRTVRAAALVRGYRRGCPLRRFRCANRRVSPRSVR